MIHSDSIRPHVSGSAPRRALIGVLSLAIVTLGGCGQESPPSDDPTTEGSTDPTSGSATGGETDPTTDPTTATGSGSNTSPTDPTDPTGNTTDGPPGGEVGSFFPLVDGATWTYVSRNSAGQVQGTEIVEASAVTYDGGEAFLFVDNANAQGEFTESTIARRGTAAMRVFKELKDAVGAYQVVEYDPGFMRFDDAWTDIGDKGELMYQRSQTDGMGSVPDVEMRGHTYEVLAVDQSVTVPAGTFNCTAIERVRTTGLTAGESVLFWYAAGVGKVKEERLADDRIEELSEVSIPGGAMFP